ncbi:peroxin 26 [Podospora didyma]|uniref:Peroxin 26 n=1 Tax=Podospora didyma TaxID=330526 RepID=A0AAE0KF93_9PEZI|nr:peroxin 26 [Podospora didyma]
MASNPSSYAAAALSPISSLSSSVSSSRNYSTSNISKAYRQASTLFLTRRLPEALSTVLPLVAPPPTDDQNGTPFEPAPVARASRSTRIKVWSLYLTILNAILELDPDEGKEAFGTQEWRAICTKVREGEVWEEVVRNGYHGVEGDVDSDVVINLATILLAHAKNQTLNQKRLENYLAAARTPNLDNIGDRFNPASPRRFRSPAKGINNSGGGADTPRDLNARVKILELYTLHVLLRNNEWDYAREFISMSPVLDEERREAFLQALQSLQEDQQHAERREQEERLQREDELRRSIEDARRLRAENEERERKRLEEERARRDREASEVDYGIERTPSNAGSSGRGARQRPPVPTSSSISRPLPSTKKSEALVAPPPSLGSRATMVFSNIRALVEHIAQYFQSNPALLYRTLAFVVALLLMFGRKSIREKITRVLGSSWDKVRATAGMGVKVSYI